MKVIHVNIVSNLEQVANLSELLPQEYALVGQWKAQGLLEHLLVKADNSGAILIFKDVEEARVRELIPSLPLAQHFVRVEYSAAEEQF